MASYDDGPSTSGANVAQEQTDKVSPAEQAWIDLAERVSVAGWKEALSEPIIQIRRTFQITLMILSVLSIYYSAVVISQWTRNVRKDEIEDAYDQNRVPFSNVTICAQVYLNQSFVMKNISIPKLVIQRYENYTGLSTGEFYRELTIALSVIARPRSVSQILQSNLMKIIRANPQIDDYSAFLGEASLQCPEMLRRCWFNRVEFDCCKLAVRSIDDDGICYILALNMDSDNAFPSNNTFHQTRPGPDGGLTVEASVTLDDFPWLDADADDGFRVYVNPVPYSAIQSPLGAPSGAETFIKVTPAKRQLFFNCTPHGKLGQRLVYYDPDGLDCGTEILLGKKFLKYASCMAPMYLFRPNASIVCNPAIVFEVLSAVTRPDLEQFVQSLSISPIGMPLDRILSALLKTSQDDWRETFSERAWCKKHCDRWTYDSSSSFSYLDPKESEQERKRNRMFSRINVYYGDLSYRKYREVKEYPTYLAFCDVGNVVGLYWGMSIASFFHVLYYVPRYFYVRRSNRDV